MTTTANGLADPASCLRLAIDLHQAARLIETAIDKAGVTATPGVIATAGARSSAPPETTAADHALALTSLLDRLAAAVQALPTSRRSDTGSGSGPGPHIRPGKQLAQTRSARSRLRTVSRQISHDARRLTSLIRATGQPVPADQMADSQPADQPAAPRS